jgi:very-short-patch-repair endonuclease
MSPIERLFAEEWRKTAPPLTFQHRVKVDHYDHVALYIIDFADVAYQVAIELDGMRGHSKPADITKDRKRQRHLERDGWKFIRFGGAEVMKDVFQCVREASGFVFENRRGVSIARHRAVELERLKTGEAP